MQSQIAANVTTSAVKETKKKRKKRKRAQEMTPLKFEHPIPGNESTPELAMNIEAQASKSSKLVPLAHQFISTVNPLWAFVSVINFVYSCCKNLRPLTAVCSLLRVAAKNYGGMLSVDHVPDVWR